MILSLITYPLSPKIKPRHQVYANVSNLLPPPPPLLHLILIHEKQFGVSTKKSPNYLLHSQMVQAYPGNQEYSVEGCPTSFKFLA